MKVSGVNVGRCDERDGLPGFVVSGFSAAHVLLKYAKLWEKARIK